jgi:hypothetical protein
MTLLRHSARLAALVLGGALMMSCDTRLPTQPPTQIGPSSDVTPPTITFALSAGTNNTIDLGATLNVVVTATDNVGVQTLNTTVNFGPTVLKADTSFYNPTVVSASRTVPVPLAGLTKGDRVIIRASAGDASTNFRTDSIMVTVIDTTAPRMTLFSPQSGKVVNGGDSLHVGLSASDSAGIQKVGYRVYHTGAPDSLVVVLGDSIVAAPGAAVTSLTSTFDRVLPAALAIGTYKIVGFALDGSGLSASPAPVLTFTVVDGTPPTIKFIAPAPGATINVGDPLFVKVDLHDNVGLRTVKFYAVSPRGDIALGTADTVVRYAPVVAPQNGAVFRAGLTDTTGLKRFLNPVTPLDTITGKLLVYGVVTDAAGNVTTDTVAIQMTKGPNVTLVAPVVGDSLTRGTKLRISVTAASGVGVSKLGFDVASGTTGPAWPTPIGPTTYEITLPTPATKAGPYTVDIDIPADAPSLGVLTISPHAADVNGQPGAPTPLDFVVRTGAAPPPLVRQSIASRIELRDSVVVYASGAALTQVGYVIRDILTGLRVDSNSVTATSSSFGPQGIIFTLGTQWQGKRVSISAFARDSAGKVGWAVPAGFGTPVTDTTKMARDTVLVVYGRTYSLPASRPGVIADILVDTINRNVFLSNISAGRLEVFQESSASFDPNGVVVGSQPWGMALSRTAAAHDTLYVANSGGTNLSRVYIGGAPSTMKEDLANRLKTRVSFLYKISEVRDVATQKIRITLSPPILFSDRPQYVEQSAAGRLYISTKPTIAAPRGTVRYIDPAAPAPDERFILAYAAQGGDPNSYLVANIDGAFVNPASAASTASDTLTLCDHPSGSLSAPTCASSDGGIGAAVAALRAAVPTTDVDARANLDEGSLGLTDTTFVATSQDGQWIAFGEGHSTPIARTFLLRDDGSVPNSYTYATPSIFVQDLINNAADAVFGLALDKTGQTLAVHGAESYFAFVDQPFTQRLQGKKTTFNVGAGIAFHPGADGINTPQDKRLAFVASANGTVEMVDIAHYDFNRGTLVTKSNFYGPLRVVTPSAADQAAGILVKLYGMTVNGLVVIDVTAGDILPGP